MNLEIWLEAGIKVLPIGGPLRRGAGLLFLRGEAPALELIGWPGEREVGDHGLSLPLFSWICSCCSRQPALLRTVSDEERSH